MAGDVYKQIKYFCLLSLLVVGYFVCYFLKSSPIGMLRMVLNKADQVRDEILLLSSSVVGCLPGMPKTLSLVPGTEKRRVAREVEISWCSHTLLKAVIISSGCGSPHLQSQHLVSRGRRIPSCGQFKVYSKFEATLSLRPFCQLSFANVLETPLLLILTHNTGG